MNDLSNLHAEAARVEGELVAQRRLWDEGLTRRKVLAGLGAVGVAAFGTQLVTAKASYAATPAASKGTLIVIFMRGAADGLRILVPNSSSLGLDYLQQVRPGLIPGASTLLPLSGAGGWALNGGMAPLLPFWRSNELAFIPAVSDPGLVRSHFEAQNFLEAGGAPTRSDGWLDRVLAQLGAGTTFRAVSEGGPTPTSLAGTQTTLAMSSLAKFTFPSSAGGIAANETVINALYRGVGGYLAEDVPTAIAALKQVATMTSATAKPQNDAAYPAGNFGVALADFANLIRANVGLQVGTIDVGGWDTHTSEASELDPQIAGTASALAAFMQDLGPTARKNVTVVLMTEFGRRVTENASGGTDHGHGSVAWVLGGGLRKAGVYGKWAGLSASALDQGDVPGTNNAFDVLGELVQTRLGIGSLSTVFPNHSYVPIGFTSKLSASSATRRGRPQLWDR